MNTLKHPIALTPPVSSETGLAKDAQNVWGWRCDLPIPAGIIVAKGRDGAGQSPQILSKTINGYGCANPMASDLPRTMGSQDSRTPRGAFTSVGLRTYRAHIAAHGMGDLSATYAEQANASLRAGHCSHPPSTAPWVGASAPIWVTHRRLALAP
jgi:hypothetical protein